jgi:predicted transcriptional regulator
MAYSENQKEKASTIIGAAGKSQVNLAKLLGVSEAQVILLKKGRAGFKGDQLKKLRDEYSDFVRALYVDDDGHLLSDYFAEK